MSGDPPRLTSAEYVWAATVIAVPYVYASTVYDGALLPRLFVLQVALAVLATIALADPARVARPSPYLLWPLAGLVAWQALSVLTAAGRTQAALAFTHYATLTAVPLLGAATIRPAAFPVLARCAVWAGLPIALVGVAQYLGLGFYWIPSNAQPSATFFHRNAAAEYLIAIIPIAAWCLACSRTRGAAWRNAAPVGLLGVYLVFTRARGAWVGLACAGIVAAVVYARYVRASGVRPTGFRAPALLAAGLILLAAFVPERIAERGSQPFDEKKSDAFTAIASIVSSGGHRGRPELWRHTLSMIADHPFVGVGPGHWAYEYPAYAIGEHTNVSASPRRPHNDFLWIAAESGIPALLAWLVFILAALRGAAAIARRRPEHAGLALALGAVVIGHLVESLFNFPRERVAPSLLFGFGLAGIFLLSSSEENRALKVPRAAAALALVFFAACGILAANRMRYDVQHLNVHVAERAEDWTAVVSHGEAAREIGAYRENTFIALGRAYYRSGRFEDAIAEYERALAIHPNSINALNNLGIALRRAHRLPEAENALRRAIALFPDFREAHYNLGNVLKDLGRNDASLVAFETAAQGPPHPQILFALGRAYLVSGRLMDAQDAFLRALDADPEFTPAAAALESMGANLDALNR